MTINQFRGKHFFLSNFYPAEVHYEGITYPTSEHAYQAAKTNSTWHRLLIASLASPGKAKKAGKKLNLLPNWNNIKIQKMEDILHIKFAHPELREMLLSTGNEELVEGNWWNDTFWGVRLDNNIGTNNLGKILMKLRSEFVIRSER